MEGDPFFTSKEISDYLDKMSEQGLDLENSVLWINKDYFESIPNIKPNAVIELYQSIYGVDYKLVKDLKENYILKSKNQKLRK